MKAHKASIYKFVGLLVLVLAMTANAEELMSSSTSPLIAKVNTSELAANITTLADSGLGFAGTVKENKLGSATTVVGPSTWALVALGVCGLLVARRASTGK